MSMMALPCLLGAAGCKKKVDGQALEQEIVAKLGPQLHTAIDKVDCPDGVKAEKGKVIACTASTDGLSFVVETTITEMEGSRLQLSIETKDVVIVDKLMVEVTKKLNEMGKHPTFKCWRKLVKLGDTVECGVTAPELEGAKKIVVNTSGTISWKIEELTESEALKMQL